MAASAPRRLGQEPKLAEEEQLVVVAGVLGDPPVPDGVEDAAGDVDAAAGGR